MEVIRRVLLVLGLCSGLFAYFATRPAVLAVGVEDFAADKSRAEEMPTGFLHRDKTLEEFHRTRTEGRILEVEGEEWLALHETVRAATVEGVGEESLLARRGRGSFADDLFYLPDEPRLAGAFEAFGSRSGLLYVAIGGSGPEAPTLTLVEIEPSVAADSAPGWLLRPFRPWAVWLMGGALAVYALLPRPSRREGDVRYGPMQAVLMPDILATMLLVCFFGLPLFVIPQMDASVLDPAGAWWIPTLIMWAFLLAPLVIYAITARNAAFTGRIEEEALLLTRWNGRSRISFAELDSVRAVTWRTPKALRALAWLTVLATGRGVRPALTMDQGGGAGIEILAKDGSPERIWLGGLHGWEGLVAELEGRGASLTDEVRELLKVAKAGV